MVPTSSSTFGDILLRLAVETGLSLSADSTTDNSPILPSDPATLWRLKDIANAAWREFQRSSPRGWSWQFPIVTLTFPAAGNTPENIGGDAGRVRLPDGITSLPIGQLWATYQSSGWVLEMTNDGMIDAMAASNDQPGRPVYASIAPASDRDVGSRVRYALRIYPKPQYDVTIKAKFRLSIMAFGALGDALPCPPEFDDVVLAFALHEVAQRGNVPRSPDKESAATRKAEMLAQALATDAMMRPKSLGVIDNPAMRVRAGEVPYVYGLDGPITVAGVPI